MKILKIIFFVFFFSIFGLSKANNIPVEIAFKDIDKNYKYYNELQTLYDRWIIFPDENENFNAKKNLTRDEFVWIISEISCSECIKPNVDFQLTKNYSDKNIFFDLKNNNKFFYCIADSVEKWRVTGYQEGTVCQNWISKSWEKPFCPENNIILEEALAIILRSWNILSIDEAEKIRKEITSWISYPNILNISPKLWDWSVYSFYPDLKKAYEYTFLDFDKNWVEKKLKLWDFGNTIDAKKIVTREDFLRISYIALKNNSCKPKSENKFWLKIEVLDKSCTTEKENCEITNFPDNEKIFDLRWQISNFNKNWFTYSWRIYDYETLKYSNFSWNFIDNYNFKKDWKYRVFLNTENPKFGKSEVFVDIVLKNKNPKNNITNNQNNNLKINIFNSKCSENIAFCIENLNWNIFDLKWEWWSSDYTWEITNLKNWKTEKFSWEIINDKKFENWEYKMTLISKDINWNKIEISKNITIWNNNSNNSNNNNNWLTSSIITDKIRAWRWEVINFSWITNIWNNVNFSWDFWDWKTSFWKDQVHNFSVNWVYTVNLIVTDDNWNISTSKVNIIISNTPWFEWNGKDSDWDWVTDEFDNEINTPKDRTPYICKLEHIEKNLYGCKDENLWVYNPNIERVKTRDLDSDGDWIIDKNDLCKDIKWDKNNFWCPIFEEKCRIDNDCKDWYFCENGFCKIKKHNLNCAYSGKNLIIWKAECNSCPCSVNLDFNASLRECDIIFPAITSPNKTDIYSKGKYFQIKKVEN